LTTIFLTPFDPNETHRSANLRTTMRSCPGLCRSVYLNMDRRTVRAGPPHFQQ